MDLIVSSAIEEICAHGQDGVHVQNLWSMIEPSILASNLDLSNGVKNAVWTQLLRVPSLQFQINNNNNNAKDPSIQSFQNAETLNLKVVAKEYLRDNFVGLYNANSNMSTPQRRVLERLAIARKNGLTQNQLAKEFGIEGRNFFYVVKSLESQGLIVRQSAVVRTKEALPFGEPRNTAIVSTNLMYLYRYAKHLGCQQKLEITKEQNDPLETATVEGGKKYIKEDVLVKDNIPKMKAICDKLEAANGKVLVVYDIKKDLGYIGSSSGHKAWREICKRLEKARIVEVFEAKVNNKFDCCLRLLKKFSPNCFESNSLEGEDDIDGKHLMKFGRKCEVTDQLVELAIENQIYDMIDASGFEGMTLMEVCKRLGIDHKRNYSRLVNMFTRFGMHLQAETHNKCNLYRVWTHGNFKPEYTNRYFPKLKENSDEHHIISMDDSKSLAQTTSLYDCTSSEYRNLEVDNAASTATEDGKMFTEVCDKSCSNRESNLSFLCLLQESVLGRTCSIPDVGLSSVKTIADTNVTSWTSPPSALSRSLIPGSNQRYPSLSFTVDSAWREQKILEWLQDEKFILKAELHKWINDHEKDKSMTTDRKTIVRSINKLQREGHCKCVDINVPVLTNCARTRVIQVVLHPSIEMLSPQLLSEIHDKLRSFENLSRGHSLTKVKNNELLPVLKGIQRTQNNMDSDSQAVRSEAMRANGFVLAKMVRVKLLHCFLWDYVNCSGGSNGISSSEISVLDLKNPHTGCKLFLLEDAIRSVPIELFLQVVGSTKKFGDMVEKCKRGLSLADLAPEEYKHLMDASATGRLSLIIDILRRLKLVRFVAESLEEVNNNGHATLKHALELKPYIEEPVSKDASTSLMFRGLDLRPRIRHDFILSSREAVNEYWQTLEYCYAAVDSKSALLAFPGSAVREVFLSRSWASVRVMTAEQRAALLERVVKRDLSEKLSYIECEKIAKDLNLTLEQVLRVYYDRRQRRLNSFEGKGDVSQQSSKSYSSQGGKLPEERSLKRARLDEVSEQLDGPRLNTFPENFIQPNDIPLQEIHDNDNHLETEVELCPEEDEACCSALKKFAISKMKPPRQRRFLWTDETDRQLIIQYVRYRAALGPKYHRTNWSSISNLPAPPSTCRKRMALLNGCIRFREIVMKLCNILGKRYVKHLEKYENVSECKDDNKLILRSSKGKDLNRNSGDGREYSCEMDLQEEKWDDFDDRDVKMALNEVLHYKKMATLEASKRVGSVYDNWSDANACTKEKEYEVITSKIPENASMGERHRKFSVRRSKSRSLHQRFTKILNGRHVSKEVYESLAVSNAVELFKLIFSSTSTALEVPNLLAENLRRYSEHDLFSAFSYLREKKIMIGGNNGEPFMLSQNFLRSISKSPFPANTGERASKFSKFLLERDKDLMENGINLPADLQCGDIFHLFALISAGDLSICSCLPDDGVGEPEDWRRSKRKVDGNEPLDDGPAKRLKFAPGEGEVISRREKGFPGIVVSICSTTILGTNAMELSKSWKGINEQVCGGSDQFHVMPTQTRISFEHMDGLCDTNEVVTPLGNYSESPWETMTAFANRLILVHCDQEDMCVISPEVFKLVYSAIQLAGDQGLGLEEVSHVANLQGEKQPQLIVDVLQTFRRVLKVNSFDDIRVVDALYRSKYFLTSVAGSVQNRESPPSVNMLGKNDSHLILHPENFNCEGANPENQMTNGASSSKETKMIVGQVHKVTILNLPPEVDESKTNNMHECPKDKTFLTRGGNEGECIWSSSSELNMPILPWINGDGTTNKIVYKGLRRRIFGIVMQNPGILEVDIINRMNVLNPQSCKKLLELMMLDNHLKVRKLYQSMSSGPPGILGILLGRSYRESKLVCREHFFANPKSTSLL